jgi:hypothetical protein
MSVNQFTHSRHWLLVGALTLLIALPFGASAKGKFPAATQAQIDVALAKLAAWAADTDVVSAVKSANASPNDGMTNGKWVELDKDATEVAAITSSPVSKQLGAWKSESGLNKLFLRSKDGALVAGAAKPLVYNVKKRKPFTNAIKGKSWHAGKAKPDPTTQIKSVQISVPVKDGAEVIGVLHSSVIVP